MLQSYHIMIRRDSSKTVELHRLHIYTIDARNYIILGDPATRMPPLATSVPDAQALNLLRAWITEME